MEYDALLLFLVVIILLTTERLRFSSMSRVLWLAVVLSALAFLFNPLTTKTARSTFNMSDRLIDVIGIGNGLLLLFVLLASATVALSSRGWDRGGA